MLKTEMQDCFLTPLHCRFERFPDHGIVEISHEVNAQIVQFGYEPYFIADVNTVPKYDERFLGYGFTRNTQV